ncbi:MAG: hypothetical protein CL728_04760, partial [Chloroflexi bacterium]|nr:hypothetical protein [Chloroflexota bacterium]
CHTTFSWKTGNELINAAVHNPHYFEYRRNNNLTIARNPLDIPGQCGNHWYLIDRTYNTMNPRVFGEDKRTIVGNVIRLTRHIQHVDMRVTYPLMTIDDYGIRNLNQSDRILYMLNRITEKKFKEILQKREKHMLKTNEIHQVLEMETETMIEILYKFSQANTISSYRTFEEELKNLRVYGNNSLLEISKRYNCVVPLMYENFRGTYSSSKGP